MFIWALLHEEINSTQFIEPLKIKTTSLYVTTKWEYARLPDSYQQWTLY